MRSIDFTHMLCFMFCMLCFVACRLEVGYLTDAQQDPLGTHGRWWGWASILEEMVRTGSGSMTYFLWFFFPFCLFRAGISVFPIYLMVPEHTTAFLET